MRKLLPPTSAGLRPRIGAQSLARLRTSDVCHQVSRLSFVLKVVEGEVWGDGREPLLGSLGLHDLVDFVDVAEEVVVMESEDCHELAVGPELHAAAADLLDDVGVVPLQPLRSSSQLRAVDGALARAATHLARCRRRRATHRHAAFRVAAVPHQAPRPRAVLVLADHASGHVRRRLAASQRCRRLVG